MPQHHYIPFFIDNPKGFLQEKFLSKLLILQLTIFKSVSYEELFEREYNGNKRYP